VHDASVGVRRGKRDRHNHAVASSAANRSAGRSVGAAFFAGDVSCLQDVISGAVGGPRDTRADVAVIRHRGGAHMVRVRPHQHDFINAGIVANGKVFGCPHSAPAAIAGCCEAPLHVANMPGEQLIRHNLGRTLRHRVDNRVFNEGGQTVRHAQGVHGHNQVPGGDIRKRHGFSYRRGLVGWLPGEREQQKNSDEHAKVFEAGHISYIPQFQARYFHRHQAYQVKE